VKKHLHHSLRMSAEGESEVDLLRAVRRTTHRTVRITWLDVITIETNLGIALGVRVMRITESVAATGTITIRVITREEEVATDQEATQLEVVEKARGMADVVETITKAATVPEIITKATTTITIREALATPRTATWTASSNLISLDPS
jgi:hypothetical protein